MFDERLNHLFLLVLHLAHDLDHFKIGSVKFALEFTFLLREAYAGIIIVLLHLADFWEFRLDVLPAVALKVQDYLLVHYVKFILKLFDLSL